MIIKIEIGTLLKDLDLDMYTRFCVFCSYVTSVTYVSKTYLLGHSVSQSLRKRVFYIDDSNLNTVSAKSLSRDISLSHNLCT